MPVRDEDKKESKQIAANDKAEITSESIQNAHASGDGALERSDESPAPKTTDAKDDNDRAY